MTAKKPFPPKPQPQADQHSDQPVAREGRIEPIFDSLPPLSLPSFPVSEDAPRLRAGPEPAFVGDASLEDAMSPLYQPLEVPPPDIRLSVSPDYDRLVEPRPAGPHPVETRRVEPAPLPSQPRPMPPVHREPLFQEPAGFLSADSAPSLPQQGMGEPLTVPVGFERIPFENRSFEGTPPSALQQPPQAVPDIQVPDWEPPPVPDGPHPDAPPVPARKSPPGKAPRKSRAPRPDTPPKKHKTMRMARRERRRRRVWFEELVGWIFVPVILVALYWAGTGLLSIFGKNPQEVWDGLMQVYRGMR